MFVKLFEDFDNFINEAIESDHFTKRVEERIMDVKIVSIGEYKKNPAKVLERCKKVLKAKLRMLVKKSYPGDSIYYIENFGKILIKDSKGTYAPIFSTDDEKYKGTVFVSIVFNNLLVTAYCVNGNKNDDEIKASVVKHSNELYPEYEQKYRGVEQKSLGEKQTIIDMDMSDEAFEKLVNPPAAKWIAPMAKPIKEMSVNKDTEIIIMTIENGREVYRKKTIESVKLLSTKSMLMSFTDRDKKTFTIDGDRLAKKFIITPAKASDNKYYVGNIIEFGVKKGHYFVKIEVSQTLDKLGTDTHQEE